jgi:hypothetical protein
VKLGDHWSKIDKLRIQTNKIYEASPKFLKFVKIRTHIPTIFEARHPISYSFEARDANSYLLKLRTKIPTISEDRQTHIDNSWIQVPKLQQPLKLDEQTPTIRKNTYTNSKNVLRHVHKPHQYSARYPHSEDFMS